MSVLSVSNMPYSTTAGVNNSLRNLFVQEGESLVSIRIL